MTLERRRLRCWAEIDLAALERNLRLIRASLPPHMRYVAVVKADAYGHGLHPVAARLMHAGADLFAVANVTEAATLREIGPGWPILILSPLLPSEDDALADRAEGNSTDDTSRRCGWLCCSRQHTACQGRNAGIDSDYIMEPCDLFYEMCVDGLPD